MINQYLNYLQEEMVEGYNRPKILYHAADKLTKTLKPRITNLKTPVRAHTAHHTNAIFTAETPLYGFGLERPHMMIPKKYTEKEVRYWKYSCWMGPEHPYLFIYYWNYIPKKPLYMYKVPSDGFKPMEVESLKKKNKTLGSKKRGQKISAVHWFNQNEVIPLSVKKYMPNQVKKVSWKIMTDEDWEFKIQRYKENNFFK